MVRWFSEDKPLQRDLGWTFVRYGQIFCLLVNEHRGDMQAMMAALEANGFWLELEHRSDDWYLMSIFDEHRGLEIVLMVVDGPEGRLANINEVLDKIPAKGLNIPFYIMMVDGMGDTSHLMGSDELIRGVHRISDQAMIWNSRVTVPKDEMPFSQRLEWVRDTDARLQGTFRDSDPSVKL